MAIALGLETLLGNIAAVSVTGVRIVDIDEITEQVDTRIPTLYPNPEGFITALEVVRVSQGAGGTALMDVKYTLNYRFCYAPVGSGRNLADLFGNLTALVVDIIEAFLAEDDIAGVIDMEVQDIPAIGPVLAPNGETFIGCDLSFRITEFQN